MSKTNQPYGFSISRPVSFWKRNSIQQHAGNTEGLADAGGDDGGAVGQERGLCRKEEDRNTQQGQEKT